MKDVDLEKGAYPSDSPKALRISRGGETPSAIAPFGIPLYSYTAVPGFLQGNPYITDGYRAHLSPKLCVKSACICSNETINIWSHILGLFYFTLLQYDDNFYFLPQNNGDFGDHLTFTIMNLCFQICMFCSAGFHMFACQSEGASRRWLSLDLGGVSVGLCGCYFPGAYYAFYCDEFWQTAYMIAMTLLAISSLVAQAHPQFLSNQWHCRRLFLYSASIFAGVVPVMHWFLINGGFVNPVVQVFMPKIVFMYGLAVAGGLFYVTHFPEKWFPGKLNLIGSSHQWWHLMVLLSFVWAHHMGEIILLYWKSHDCQVMSTNADIKFSLKSFLGWT